MPADLKLVTPDKGWSKSALAAEFGMARQTIEKLVRPVPAIGKNKGNPVWRLLDVVIPIADQLRGQVASSSHDPESMSPKDRNDWFHSETRRLAFEKEERQLLTVEEFNDGLSRSFRLMKNFIERVPDVLELRAGLTPEQTELLIDLCDQLGNELHIEMISDDRPSDDHAES